MQPVLICIPTDERSEMQLIDFRQAARARGQQPRSLARLITDFLADGRIAGRSPRTLDDHAAQLDRLATWLRDAGVAWHAATHADLTAYLRTRAHLGRSSRAHAVTSLRVFFAWLVSEGLRETSPAARLQTPPKAKAVPKALSADQLAQLLAHLATLADGTPANRRDRLLCLTGLYAGLRAAELATLTWDQVDRSGQTITIPESKMARGRTVRLHPDLAAELTAWKAAQPAAGAVGVQPRRKGDCAESGREGGEGAGNGRRRRAHGARAQTHVRDVGLPAIGEPAQRVTRTRPLAGANDDGLRARRRQRRRGRRAEPARERG